MQYVSNTITPIHLFSHVCRMIVKDAVFMRLVMAFYGLILHMALKFTCPVPCYTTLLCPPPWLQEGVLKRADGRQ